MHKHKLFPELEPYKTQRLKVSDIHELYIEECGNPNGSPIVFLHGGPGGGLYPACRQFFDPEHYRIVLFDQRGAGQSTPSAEIKDNSTWDLVEDMEKVRKLLDIEKWIVFGGSWGSTLSLAYAQTHPDRVKGLVLRGIFLCRPKEIHWFYQEGASKIFPDNWEEYIAPIPKEERDDLVKAFYKRLTSDDADERFRAARAWSHWEGGTSKLIPDQKLMHEFDDPNFVLAFARIECHYFTNNAFFDTDNYLIENIDKIRNIPCEVVHGRYDVVCPIESAWELHKAWPESKLHIIQDSGHSAIEKGIASKLIEVTERFKSL